MSDDHTPAEMVILGAKELFVHEQRVGFPRELTHHESRGVFMGEKGIAHGDEEKEMKDKGNWVGSALIMLLCFYNHLLGIPSLLDLINQSNQMQDMLKHWGNENQRSGDPKSSDNYRTNVLETLLKHLREHKRGQCLQAAW